MAALCRLWELETKVDPSLLAASIQNSKSIFGHRQAKLVEGEAMQAALLGKHHYCAYSFGKPFCASFLLKLLGKSSLKTPWVLVVSPLTTLMQDQAKKLSRVAGVVPAVLLTEEAGLTVGNNGG